MAAARDTGLPILMVRSWGRRQIVFKNTWFQPALVAPFSRVAVFSDGPIHVPPRAGREELEQYRLLLEERLNRLADASESYFC